MNNDDDYFYRVYDLDRKDWFKTINGRQLFSNIGSAKTASRHALYIQAERFEIWRIYCGKDSVLEAVQRNEDITRFISTKVFEQ